MEWLSHTQKKYCELCKTPFRFTKLYDPQMPNHLPTRIFLRRAVIHLLAYMLTWCRALLVAFVWIVCLPWCMRSAWSMMFWFGDAGWARDRLVNETAVSAWMDEHLAGAQRVSLQEPNSTNQSLTAALEYAASAGGKCTLHTLCRLFVNMLTEIAIDPIVWRLLKTMGRGLMTALHYDSMNPATLGKASERGEPAAAVIQPSSLLSDVPFLRDLFPSPYVNRLIIDVLEGQIITLSVVVAFILVFLIREWVVQQQPVMDLAAAEDDEALAEAGGDVRLNPLHGLHPIDPQSDDSEDDEDLIGGTPIEETVNGDGEMEIPGAASDPGMGTLAARGQNSKAPGDETVYWTSESVHHSSRPQMPSRERSFVAAETRRNLQENSLADRSSIRETEARSLRDTPELDEDHSQGTASTGSWQRIDRDGNVQPRQSIFTEDLEVWLILSCLLEHTTSRKFF